MGKQLLGEGKSLFDFGVGEEAVVYMVPKCVCIQCRENE